MQEHTKCLLLSGSFAGDFFEFFLRFDVKEIKTVSLLETKELLLSDESVDIAG